MERNEELSRLADVLVGDWTVTITNQWWLDDPSTVTAGEGRCEWLGDSFLRLQAHIEGMQVWDFVFGGSDANEQLVALYHDDRGVLRVFEVTLDDDGWVMSRTDPDMHQRLNGRIEGDRMIGQADASDDQGVTWRKDFDLIWERRR